MNKNFEDYKKAILAQYEIAKRDKNAELLEYPTPGNLKKLCLMLLEKGLSKADEDIFMNFFFPKEGQSLNGLIRNMNTDGLRTPSDFLKTGSGLTNRFHANLVAVLVDFSPRPLTKYLDSISEELEDKDVVKEKTGAFLNTEVAKEVSDEESTAAKSTEAAKPKEEAKEPTVKTFSLSEKLDEVQIITQSKPRISGSKRIALITIALLLFGGMSGFIFYKSTEERCMIWKDDHYERIDCEPVSVLSLVITPKIHPFNKELFEKQHKVIPTDTTTFFKNGEPVLYYLKQDNKCDFFTLPGWHPVNRKELHPVTTRIIRKYSGVVLTTPLEQ